MCYKYENVMHPQEGCWNIKILEIAFNYIDLSFKWFVAIDI